MFPETERMRLPAPPPTVRRPGIPVIAILAPLVMAGALWVMTASPHVLLFAVLGPVIALAGWFDGHRTLRRDRRAATSAALRGLDELWTDIQARADALRSRLELGDLAAAMPLRLGTGDLPSGIVLEGEEAGHAPDVVRAIAALRERAAFISDIVIAVDKAEVDVVVTGPAVMVRAFARALTLQVVERCPVEGSLVRAPGAEGWLRTLPHDVEPAECWEVRSAERALLRIRHGGAAIAPETLIVVLGDDAGSAARIEAPVRVDEFRPTLMSGVEATARAGELATRARLDGWRPESSVPSAVALRSLGDAPGETHGVLAASIGMDADGPVVVDLDRDGPHALVAGTTGSGKSELLITWVLSLARARSPRELGFLLIDFKGGAAFESLRALPHVVGMVSDLDPSAAARAVESLRAELRRREEALARQGARSIADMPTEAMSRLVVVIDEFAALIALDAGLQAIFADLAARGRSLGIHLVVCTQRPAGVVRESVLANVTLRICLRVLDAADSTAVVGRPSAAGIAVDARGRGLLKDASGARTVQFALAGQPDIEAVAERWSGHPRAEGRPWLDPLPPLISGGDLVAMFPSAAESSTTIGAVDLPQLQRHEPLSVDPWSSGALLVLGGSGSGRTTALEMLAHAADAEVRRIAQDPAELWQALTHPTNGRRVLVVADDVDRMLAWCDPEQRSELCELISRAARDSRRTGVALAASARSLGGAMHAVQASFEQRIILRLATREEHLLAGGELHAYRSERRPGSCVWRGAEAQLAVPPVGPRPEWRAPIPEISLIAGRWAIVAARPRDLVARLDAVGVQAMTPGAGAPEHRITVADVDGWLLEHAAVTAARRDGRLLLIGCTASDHRALTRMRMPLPPLSGDDEAWLFDGASTARVRVRLD